MSKSKRTAPPQEPVIKQEHAHLKTVGLLLLALIVWAVAALAVPVGLGLAFAALFKAWNVSAETAARAPGWAQMLYVWHGSLITLISGGLLILACVLGFKVRLSKPSRSIIKPLGFGALSAIGMTFLFLLTDSLRLYWPLSSPHLNPGLLPLGLLTLISALAEELFTKGVVWQSIRDKWGKLWATIVGTLLFFIIGGGLTGTVISGVNVLLLGLTCCILYERDDLWAPVALRWGWGGATMFLLGQGGGAYAVYRAYGVSETLFTGGDAGFAYGLMWTVILAVYCGTMVFEKGWFVRTR